jgi:hypothetical protein
MIFDFLSLAVFLDLFNSLTYFDLQFDFWMSSLGWLKVEGAKHKDMAAYQKPFQALAASTSFSTCPPGESLDAAPALQVRVES